MEPLILPVGKYGMLIYIATDRFKSELLSLSYSVPLTSATAQKNAMVTALSRRGTVTYPTQASLNRHLDEMYSTAISTSNRRIGDMQTLSFTADFLGARYVEGGKGLLPEVISILSELVRKPLLDENGNYIGAFVEGEKQVLRDAIRAAINNPRGFAQAKARELLCAGEPYGISLIGEEDSVDLLTPASLAARHRALQGEAAPLFAYVGSTPAPEVVALLENAFGDFGGKGAAYQSLVRAHEGEVKRGEVEMPLQQGKLSLGFRTDIAANHRLAPALLLVNEIYGGSPASKLFLNVREKKSLCYHCSSSLDLYKGVLFASSGMQVASRAAAEEAMLAEFYELQQGNISEVELNAAKKALANTYRGAFDNPAVLSRFYMGRVTANAFETVDAWRERLMRVTREEIVEAANHISLGAEFFLKGTVPSGEEEA